MTCVHPFTPVSVATISSPTTMKKRGDQWVNHLLPLGFDSLVFHLPSFWRNERRTQTSLGSQFSRGRVQADSVGTSRQRSA
jgi:hypothetical protein